MSFRVLIRDLLNKDKIFWSPVIGCALIHWSLGFSNTFGNTIPYITSYISLKGKHNLRIGMICWIECFFVLFQGGANYLYLSIERTIGIPYCLIIGFFSCNFGLLISYLFLENYLLYLIGYSILYAFGNGLLFASTIEFLVSHYSKNSRSKIIGLLWLFRGASMSIIPSFQSSFVNPNNSSNYYVFSGNKLFNSLVVLEKVPKLLKLTFLLSVIFQTIGITNLLIIGNKDLKIKEKQEEYISDKRYYFTNRIYISEPFIVLWLITFLTWPCIEYIQLFWKIHGMVNTNLGDLQLTRVSCIVMILQTLFRVFWGVFGQLAGYFNCICILSIILLIGIILLMFPIIESISICQYILGYLLVSIAHSGNSAIFPTTIIKHYRQSNHIDLFIYLFSAKLTSCILFCIFTDLTTRFLNINYSLVPLLIFSLGSFFLSFILRDIKDNYISGKDIKKKQINV
ncbi:membrane associated transporter [Cryptosporidium sp. chipmunk genotype I]|uniref:membrane associated transporter n=1 Tax=Cryptosporidium sp. chipmunk genotype I TaxID=1280935 RepID=UPI00351A391C|nr:membrane associated transporter [Cryptosporidium sp. chipmunk genotype I]